MGDRASAKNTDGGYGPGRRKAYIAALQTEFKTLTERTSDDKPYDDRLAQIKDELATFGEKPPVIKGRRETAGQGA